MCQNRLFNSYTVHTFEKYLCQKYCHLKNKKIIHHSSVGKHKISINNERTFHKNKAILGKRTKKKKSPNQMNKSYFCNDKKGTVCIECSHRKHWCKDARTHSDTVLAL